MKTLLVLLAMVSFAQAQDAAPTTVQSRSHAGQAWVVAVGQCSIPVRAFGTVSSQFTYTVCQETITANYNVSGKGWNKDYSLIPGTERKSYNLNQKTEGPSLWISQDQNIDLFDFMGLQLSCMSSQRAIQGAAMHISQTPCGHSN